MGLERIFLGKFLQLHITQKRLKGRIKMKIRTRVLFSSLSHFHKRSKKKLEIHPWMSIIFLFPEVKSLFGGNPY